MSEAAARPNPLPLLDRGSPFGADGDWLAVMALCTVAETGWWAIAWDKGIAPAPVVPVYVGAAAAALVISSGGQRLLNPAARRPALIVLVTALALVGLGASLFLVLVIEGASKLTQRWQRIGARVVGSWIAAAAILVLALAFSR